MICRNLHLLSIATVLALAIGFLSSVSAAQRPLPSRLVVHRSAAATDVGPTPTGQVQPAGVSISFGRIDFPRSPSGTAYGMNGKKDVVGVYGPISPIGYFGSYGYVLKGNTFSDFNYPGAVASGPLGINNKREIVGYYDPTGNYDFHAYLYKAKKFTSIDYPGSLGGAAFAINDSGEIAGTYYDSATLQHGFVLEKGVYITIDPPGSVSTEPLALNSSGVVVGDYYDSNERLHGFVYQKGQFTIVDYPGAPDTVLTGINDAGQMVGGYGADTIVGGYEWRAPNMFLVDQGQFTPLTLPVDNAYVTLSYALSDHSVIGFYVDSLANFYGFVLQFSTGQTALQSSGRQ